MARTDPSRTPSDRFEPDHEGRAMNEKQDAQNRLTPSATLDGAVRLLIEVHNELVVDHEQTQEERTKGYDLMRRIDAFIDATSAPSERGTLCGSRVCKTECAHPEDCMQQSEPTPATDAVSAAMYEHFKTRAMTVNDIEGFLAHARQLERKARVMQRVLERIPSARVCISMKDARLIQSVLESVHSELRHGNATIWADNVRDSRKALDEAIHG